MSGTNAHVAAAVIIARAGTGPHASHDSTLAVRRGGGGETYVAAAVKALTAGGVVAHGAGGHVDQEGDKPLLEHHLVLVGVQAEQLAHGPLLVERQRQQPCPTRNFRSVSD
jgi:hypothetical protein